MSHYRDLADGWATNRGGGPVVDPYGGASIVLDFAGVKNGGVPFYRVDGVQYASATDAGFNGQGAFDASGYTATGGQRIESVQNLTGDFIVCAEFSRPAASGTFILWQHTGSDTAMVIASNAATSTNPPTASSTTVTKIAFGRSGGLAVASYNNAPVVVGAAMAPQGNAVFRIGNGVSLNAAWARAIKLITIHKATLSDAQIQAL